MVAGMCQSRRPRISFEVWAGWGGVASLLWSRLEEVEGWEEGEGVELGEDGEAEEEAGEEALPAEAEEEGEHREGDDGGVEVAGAGDFPDEEGAPGVEEDLLAGTAKVTEDADERPEGEAFEENEDGLHAGDGGGDVGDGAEEQLGEGGVDGAGVARPG